ncbi:MAG: efflux RND transporter periplasmic adaptor subunit [Thermoanaerobaculia bacterium]|nr:efflux RND transporter periplasmic adaptor subunit [Thermoanaerobaculia bacterium]
MKKLLFAGVLAGLAFGAWFVYGREAPSSALVLAGSLEAHTIEVGSLVGGRIVAVTVREGDRVAAGQELVRFESDLRDLELAEQESRIAEARATLARVQAGPRQEELARARIDHQAAETDRRRFESLRDAGVVGQRDYDAAEVRAASALETLRQAERGSRVEDIAAARAALEREERRLAVLVRQHRELVVSAPADGVVESLDLRPGDLVAAHQPVASLLEPGQLWVRVFVPEPRLGEVHVGQNAAITVDSFPGRSFPGRVRAIADLGEYTPRNLQTLDQRSDQVFAVEVVIDPTAPELKAGMAALVRLEGLLGGATP